MTIKNKIIVLVGAGGSGKTSIAEALVKDEKFKNAISTTSRKKRVGEMEGKPYFFVSSKKFENMIDNNELFEWVKFNGNYYGTNKNKILNILKTNHCVLVLDCVGAKRFKREFKNQVITIYINVELDELEKRLIARGETEANIKNRLKLGALENAQKNDFDFVISNEFGKLEQTVNMIKKIVEEC